MQRKTYIADSQKRRVAVQQQPISRTGGCLKPWLRDVFKTLQDCLQSKSPTIDDCILERERKKKKNSFVKFLSKSFNFEYENIV